MQKQRMWGIGSTNVTKFGVPDSHRPKPIVERYGKFQNQDELEALAADAGIGVKRLKRDLHAWRKAGIVPAWA